METLDEIFRRCDGMADYGRRYADYVCAILAGLDYGQVAGLVDVLERAWDGGHTVFVAGNGGSAATASHWALDLRHGTRIDGVRPFRALSLVDHAALLTALSNDRCYEDTIVGQLEGVFGADDVLIVISASGNSPNILRAVEFANERGGTTVGLTGFDGGRLKRLCRLCIHAATPSGQYGPVEDVHLVLDHMVVNFLRARRAARAVGVPPADAEQRPALGDR
jgi:D-sedoheptulose 7-phosphate isomerase